jgi:hypothetical protein
MEKEKYILEDGSEIIATSPADFVTKLRQSSFFENNKLDELYMREFAERYWTQTGNSVRTDTPEHFVKDLKNFGYIK